MPFQLVFFVAGDPVQLVLVGSLSHPGNLTGATTLTLEVGAKRLQLLHEAIPTAAVIAALINPTSANLAEIQSRDLRAAARVLTLQLHVLETTTAGAFSRANELGVQGLVIASDSFFLSRGGQLASPATRYKLPTIYGFRVSAAAGGLMSYGGGLTESFRWLGVYSGQILKSLRRAGASAGENVGLRLGRGIEVDVNAIDQATSPRNANCCKCHCGAAQNP